MPMPHEQAAIDRASGPERQRLADAASVLDRVRAEYPGASDPQKLPEHVRADALNALRTFRPRRGFGLQAMLLLVLAVGLFLLWFKPLRVFRCASQGSERAACVVSERLLGLLPLGQQTVAGIAQAESGEHTSSSESRDDKGRTRTVTTRVEELAFKDQAGRVLWSGEESHLLGATPEQLASELNELIAGEAKGPLVRVQGIWPVLLIGTLFVTIALSALASELGLLLRDRGLIPQTVYMAVFYWGALIVPVLLFGLAWAVALLGAQPPEALVSALRLG